MVFGIGCWLQGMVRRLEVGDWSGYYWRREVARIRDGVSEEGVGWFSEMVLRKGGRWGRNSFFGMIDG